MRLRPWPVVRQLLGVDRRGLRAAVQPPRSTELTPRIADAEVVQSVCPYCAVGCGQRVFVKDGEIVQIEGDPDSPISRGRLCPRARRRAGPGREYKVKYRRPYGVGGPLARTRDGHDRRPRDRHAAARLAGT